MEIILGLLLVCGLGYYVLSRQPKKNEVQEPAPYKVETQEQPAWHTAPAEGSKLAENTLDVNHDGKVDLEDVKEVVKKARGKSTPAAAKKAPAKKVAAKKQQFEKKPAAAKTPRAKKSGTSV